MTKIKKHGRWAEWEAAVLSKVRNPLKCQQTVMKRQQAIDDDQDEADLVKQHIAGKLQSERLDPNRCHVFLPSIVLASWITEVVGKTMPPTKVTPYLKTLGIPELLRPGRTAKKAGWIWKGQKAKKGEELKHWELLRKIP